MEFSFFLRSTDCPLRLLRRRKRNKRKGRKPQAFTLPRLLHFRRMHLAVGNRLPLQEGGSETERPARLSESCPSFSFSFFSRFRVCLPSPRSVKQREREKDGEFSSSSEASVAALAACRRDRSREPSEKKKQKGGLGSLAFAMEILREESSAGWSGGFQIGRAEREGESRGVLGASKKLAPCNGRSGGRTERLNERARAFLSLLTDQEDSRIDPLLSDLLWRALSLPRERQ